MGKSPHPVSTSLAYQVHPVNIAVDLAVMVLVYNSFGTMAVDSLQSAGIHSVCPRVVGNLAVVACVFP